MYLENIDFFVVENGSDNSDKIKEYFLSQKSKLKGYIQFEKNITTNALFIFVKDYYDLLMTYDIFTLTDSDLYIIDAKKTWDEILKNLQRPSAIYSGCDRFLDNHFTVPNRIVGIDKFKEVMSRKKGNLEYKRGTGIGIHMMTMKVDKIKKLFDIRPFKDGTISKEVKKKGIWFLTTENIAYNMSWDHFNTMDDYDTAKRKRAEKTNTNKWWISEEICNYVKII